jgi:hypothetical protein
MLEVTTDYPTHPYESWCDMSHVTANATTTTNIVMNMTQRAQTPCITGTSFLIREYVQVCLRATGKHGTVQAANYGLRLASRRRTRLRFSAETSRSPGASAADDATLQAAL